MVQHRVARGTNRRLHLHFDQLFAIQLLKQIFGKRTRQVDAFGDGGSRRLRKHGHMFQCEIAEKALRNTGVADLFGQRRAHAFDFRACQYCGVRHVSFLYLPLLLLLLEASAKAVRAASDSVVRPTRW